MHCLPPEFLLQIMQSLDDRLPCAEESFSSSRTRLRIYSPLYACSLVCKTWNDICRPLIFRSIHIDCSGSVAHCGLSFLHLISPNLCRYILELRLSFSFKTTTIPEWLDGCFSRFVNLRVLELQYWAELLPDISAPLARGISSMLAATSLKRLVITHWDKTASTPETLFHILSACSTTLESLVIDSFPAWGHAPSMSSASLVVHLGALRSLELHRSSTPFTRSVTIECPNLITFTTSHLHSREHSAWEVPTWIPASLSELNIKFLLGSSRPLFRGPIYPSILTIQLLAHDLDREDDIFTTCLPFIDRLRQLTISIGHFYFYESTHFDALCRLLQRFSRPTLRTVLIFRDTVPSSVKPGADDLDRLRMTEAARLEELFVPFLQAGASSVQLLQD